MPKFLTIVALHESDDAFIELSVMEGSLLLEPLHNRNIRIDKEVEARDQ